MPFMAVPDYQSLMRRILALHEDGQDHPVASVREGLADQLQLTPEDRAERLPSDRAKTYDNRVGWAVTYLFRAGLLDRPRRSVYRITERGRKVLAQHPDRVDNEVLSEFEEFRAFRSPQERQTQPATTALTPAPPERLIPEPPEVQTPEERMDTAYSQLRDTLAAELLDRILEQDPDFFERLVIEVLQRMGYGGGRDEAAQRLGGTGDGGFDGVIDEDRLGLDRIYVQAKRWAKAKPVGRPDVQGFVGALAGRGATKGVFITTSSFSSQARTYVDTVQARVVLVDGRRLTNLMICLLYTSDAADE